MGSFSSTDLHEVLKTKLRADPEQVLFAGEVTTAFLLLVLRELKGASANNLYNDIWDYWYYSNHQNVSKAGMTSHWQDVRMELCMYAGIINVDSLVPAELIKLTVVELLTGFSDKRTRALGRAIDRTLNCGKTEMTMLSPNPSKSLDSILDMGIAQEIQEVMKMCKRISPHAPRTIYEALCKVIVEFRED